MINRYIAVFETDHKGGFSVFFPDLPGCVTASDTLEEALKMASEALQFHIDGLREDVKSLPKPTPLPAIQKRLHAEIYNYAFISYT